MDDGNGSKILVVCVLVFLEDEEENTMFGKFFHGNKRNFVFGASSGNVLDEVMLLNRYCERTVSIQY